MIEIGIDPVLLKLGPFTIAWYGLFVLLAVVSAVFITTRLARKREGITEDMVYGVAMWGLIGGIIGTRLFHVADHLDYYAANPLLIFAFWKGGLAIFGAVLGGAAGGALYARLKGYPVGRIADLAVPGLLVAMMIGRLGNIINGDDPGYATTVPWAFVYTNPNSFASLNVPTHPAVVYEMLWDGLVLLAVWRLWGRLSPSGALFIFYLTLYSFGKFLVTFFRTEPILLAGLREAHLVALAVMLVGIPWLALKTKLLPKAKEKSS